MPAAAAHCFFGEKVLSFLPPSYQSIIQPEKNSFFFGCQGPDVLFYCHPLRRPNPGTRMHREAAAEVFQALVFSCREQASSAALAYLFGFACHYALDSTAHPLIEAVTADRLSPRYCLTPSYAHRLCESDLDGWIITHYTGCPRNIYPIYKLLRSDSGFVPAAAGMLTFACRTALGVPAAPKDIRPAFSRMQRIQRMLHDPANRRRLPLRLAESLVGQTGFFSAMIPPVSPLPEDCPNLQHAPWRHPDGSIRTDSYFELQNDAVKKALLLVAELNRCISGDPFSLSRELFQKDYLGSDKN